MKITKRIFITALYIQLLPLVTLYSFFVRAIITLGRVPSYNNPDPKELGFRYHYQLVYDVSDLTLLSVCALLIAGIYYLIVSKSIFNIRQEHFVISVGLLLIHIVTLFHPIMEWFVD